MRIVYLIGNGFDINLGLKTRYSDFYTEFHKQKFKAKGTELLKTEIKENTKDWSNFEEEFGKFTSHFGKNVSEFKETYKDVVLSLSKYLLKVENSLDLKKINKDQFVSNIINPQFNLLPYDALQIKKFKEKWKDRPVTINFITYNYTKVIEKIFGEDNSIKIGETYFGETINIEDIKHVHGYLDKRMLIGVNDKSQITNEHFKEQDEIKYDLIKSISNEISKEMVMDDCITEIKKAQLICIFGSSLGNTDLMWWEILGEKLKIDQNCFLIIFSRGADTNPLIPSEKMIIENEVRDDFFKKIKISAAERKTLEKKIIISVNSNMFNILAEEKMNIETKNIVNLTE